MTEFTIGEQEFLSDGKPFRVVSGAMHYFRVPREYWKDRLLKIKACGFNTVETYTAWNLHEPEEKKYDFEGMLDLGAYLDMIAELGMYAIVRPGPYICSEWEFGGFPWWLLKYDNISLRCMNKPYLEKVDRYFDKLIPIIAERQITKGGNVIMVQVENEYGSYGDDSEYIRYIAAGLKNRGIEVPLFTSDGACDSMLTGGTVPEIFKTCNFGSKARWNFDFLRKYQKDGPLMCAEFWNGWFDHWEEKHHHRNPQDAAESFEEILQQGASISVYMMHGGTNFGFMNGANCTDDEYQPTVNSYDDDAPISESGELTEKYYLFKDVLAKYGFENDIEVSNVPSKSYGTVTFTQYADLFNNIDVLSTPVESADMLTMEKTGAGYGFILYKTFIKGAKEEAPLVFDAHDLAYIYADGKYIGRQYRNDKKSKLKIAVPENGLSLSILVENMGRVNYGPYMRDEKGIVSSVRIGQQFIYHWKAYPLTFENIDTVKYTVAKKVVFNKHPQFLKGFFDAGNNPQDTFIHLDNFKKGLVFLNGKILSRYWDKGPQKSVYVPAPFMKQGVNEIVILETEGYSKPAVELKQTSDLG